MFLFEFRDIFSEIHCFLWVTLTFFEWFESYWQLFLAFLIKSEYSRLSFATFRWDLVFLWVILRISDHFRMFWKHFWSSLKVLEAVCTLFIQI
jgi:hypothetical protein